MIAKINELIGSSPVSFEDAAVQVLERANRTLRGVSALRVLTKQVRVEEGSIVAYVLRVRLIFEMAPETEWHV
ncbi:MAG: dodecin family protein [Myxococcota bacterium]